MAIEFFDCEIGSCLSIIWSDMSDEVVLVVCWTYLIHLKKNDFSSKIFSNVYCHVSNGIRKSIDLNECINGMVKKRNSQRVSNSLRSKLNEFICRYQFDIIKKTNRLNVKTTETSQRRRRRIKFNYRTQHIDQYNIDHGCTCNAIPKRITT